MPSDPARVSSQALEVFVSDLFTRLGLLPEHAGIVAKSLLVAHFRGFDTHGVSCIPGYVKSLRAGRFNPRPEITIERTFPWSCIVDGDNGMGHVTATRAMREALSSAESNGIGMSVVRHGNHIGAACVYPLMAVERDCIGLTTANAAKNVAPWGSRESLLGTNPIAVAVPAGRHPPFVMDMATSTAARRKLRDAMENGMPIPEGWALDSKGRPTTDAKEAFNGVSLPFGGPKGSALSMLIDILSGVLSGAEFGGRVLSFASNVDRPADSGNLHLAFRIDAFMPVTEFKARMDELFDRVKALEPADGFEDVRYPGERGAGIEEECSRLGIPLSSKVIRELTEIGDEVGVPFPKTET